jgi:hypothetical protein
MHAGTYCIDCVLFPYIVAPDLYNDKNNDMKYL